MCEHACVSIVLYHKTDYVTNRMSALSAINETTLQEPTGPRLNKNGWRLTGYQTYVSTYYAVASQNLSDDRNIPVEEIPKRDIFREIATKWNETPECVRRGWKAYAEGDTIQAPVDDQFVQRPARGVTREPSVLDDQPTTWNSMTSPLQMQTHVLNSELNWVSPNDYFAQHDLGGAIGAAIEAAAKVNAADPQAYIGKYLLRLSSVAM